MSSIFDKLDPVVLRHQEIEELMAQPDVATDFARIQQLAKERASLEELVGLSIKHKGLVQEQMDLKSLVEEGGDQELVAMAREELDGVAQMLDDLAEASVDATASSFLRMPRDLFEYQP